MSLTCWLYFCWNSPVSLFAARLHCWLMVNLLYMRTSRLFYIKKKSFLSNQFWAYTEPWGHFDSRRTLHFFCCRTWWDVCRPITVWWGLHEWQPGPHYTIISPWFSITQKIAASAFHPFIQVTDEDSVPNRDRKDDICNSRTCWKK